MKFKPDVIKLVKTRFEPFEIEMDEVKDRLTTIYDQPFMVQFTDEKDRQMAAVKILMAQVIAANDKAAFSKAETILMRIESKEEVTSFKRRDGTESYRSNLYVTAMYDETATFGQVTLWGDANEIQPNITVGKTYLIPAVVNEKSPLSLSINDTPDLDVSDEVLPPLGEIILNDFVAIEIGEMEINISRDWNDLKLVRGTVLSSWMKVTKTDKNMGFLKMVGDDSEEITVIKFSKNADQVIMYGVGSLVYVLGQITEAVNGEDGLEKFPVGMWGNLIVPMLVIPPELKDMPGIESSETSITKPDGSETGFVADDVEGW